MKILHLLQKFLRKTEYDLNKTTKQNKRHKKLTQKPPKTKTKQTKKKPTTKFGSSFHSKMAPGFARP